MIDSYVEELIGAVSKIMKHRESINTRSQENLRELNALYHEVETSNYNAADGYNAYKRLRHNLRRGHILKDELDKILLLKNTSGLDFNKIEHELNASLAKLNAKTKQSAKTFEEWAMTIAEAVTPDSFKVIPFPQDGIKGDAV